MVASLSSNSTRNPPSAIGSRRDGLRRRGVRRWSAHADAWDSAKLGIDPEMLDQDTNEAFHAPERCAMDHDGSMSTTIGSDVPEIEPFREIVIHLNRPELPLASDDILHDEIDLRAVECGLSSLLRPLDAEEDAADLQAASASSQRLASPTYFSESGSRSPTRTRYSSIPSVPKIVWTSSMHPWISCSIWSGVTNRCASSWVNLARGSIQRPRLIAPIDRRCRILPISRVDRDRIWAVRRRA